MIQQHSSVPEMFGQSMEVITKPGVTTFEHYENRGTVTQAAIYVTIAAVVAGLFGLGGGLSGVIGGVLSTLIGFFAFTGIVYYIGKSQGGTGSFDQVAYTFSLFWVPMAIIAAIGTLILVITIVGILLLPLWGLLILIANAYFAYLAVQSSMNLTDSTRVAITLGAAVIGTWLVQWLAGNMFNFIG